MTPRAPKTPQSAPKTNLGSSGQRKIQLPKTNLGNLGRSVAALAVTLTVLGCSHKEERFESAIQIVRKEVIEKDEKGVTTAMDFEAEWDACPGDQYQVIRGGQEFAACADKYGPGDYVPVIVKHFWDPRGYYRWDIERLGDCTRPIDVDAYGSYEKSAECKDVVDYGRTIGFECSRRPFHALLKRCPWMARD